MTSKTSPIFFIVSKNTGKNKAVVGVVVHAQNRGDRDATPEEQQQIIATVRESATVSLRDSLSDGAYPYDKPARVWDKRKDARAALASIKACASCFDWAIVQLGKEERDMTRKPVGYQIVFTCSGDAVYASEGNPKQEQSLPAASLKHDEYAEWLYFTTRAEARAELAPIQKDYPTMGYRLRTLYA